MNTTMKKYAIIVAGGSGSRMQSELPKQFLSLIDKPILLHTLEAFHRYDQKLDIIIVLPEIHISTWKELIKEYNCTIDHKIVSGGATRFDSVRNGLVAIEGNNGLVAIHDGARPLISSEVIDRCFESAERDGNGIAAVALKDSLRIIKDKQTQAVDRSAFMAVQTPQTFNLGIIKNAFDQAEGDTFTDDASVLEASGGLIYLVEGDYANIKVTTPEDMIVAEGLLNHRKQ